jgi:hypothetical protein
VVVDSSKRISFSSHLNLGLILDCYCGFLFLFCMILFLSHESTLNMAPIY